MANNSEKKLNGTVIVTYRCNGTKDKEVMGNLNNQT